MPKQVRVNIRTRVNAADIKHEKREGRDVIRVPSATLPDNVIMNRILYPAEEIANSFHSLERTPAPLGHPMIGNRYVSAREPEAINGYWIGAHNENVRRENGRVFLDKIIDVARAKESEKGRSVLEAIDKGEPIHTSTGVLVNLKPAEHDDYDGIATNMEFDHDAILLNDTGAATPDQGVGMLVNAEGEEIDVMDVDLDTDDLEQLAEDLASTIGWKVEREEREQKFKGLTAKILSLLKTAFPKTANNRAAGLQLNHSEEADMPLTKDDAKLIADELIGNEGFTKAVATSVTGALGETVTNAVTEAVKPVKDTVDAIQANAEAAETAERDGLIAKVVKANLLDEDTAKETDTKTLKALAANIKSGKAAGVFGGATDDSANDTDITGEDVLANIKDGGK